jgi:hypothetical protein
MRNTTNSPVDIAVHKSSLKNTAGFPQTKVTLNPTQTNSGTPIKTAYYKNKSDLCTVCTGHKNKKV